MAWTVHEINKPENIQHKRKRGAIVEPVHNPYEVGNTIEFCPPADRGRGYSTNKVQGVIIAIKGDRVTVQYKLSERLKPITTEILFLQNRSTESVPMCLWRSVLSGAQFKLLLRSIRLPRRSELML